MLLITLISGTCYQSLRLDGKCSLSIPLSLAMPLRHKKRALQQSPHLRERVVMLSGNLISDT